MSLAALGVIGIGGYIWQTYGRPIENGRYAPVLDPEVAKTLEELHALRLQSVAKIRAIDQSMIGVHGDLKKLSDQLSILDMRMNALQNVWSPLAPLPDIGAQPIIPPGKKQSQTPKPADPNPLGGTQPTAPAQMKAIEHNRRSVWFRISSRYVDRSECPRSGGTWL